MEQGVPTATERAVYQMLTIAQSALKVPGAFIPILSELHQKIQDRFNEAGIEIMSPRFSASRDGNQPAMPADHVPPDTASKSFRILPIK